MLAVREQPSVVESYVPSPQLSTLPQERLTPPIPRTPPLAYATQADVHHGTNIRTQMLEVEVTEGLTRGPEQQVQVSSQPFTATRPTYRTTYWPPAYQQVAAPIYYHVPRAAPQQESSRQPMPMLHAVAVAEPDVATDECCCVRLLCVCWCDRDGGGGGGGPPGDNCCDRCCWWGRRYPPRRSRKCCC
ncbi:unnamed protein product [Vitrella brassicaformis CCMP3155]|uniref:Uncharacterized protein n=1 Tax=Vitrella brassicaformis (strain CCMP3155) TaxID=1169540 RepID=A0A0G4EQC1_VITBC|nr:unnamed protein product [Vitrella brassicaformis CCMP3155]|eukprot:CEL99825.1 unnamed protein product [Vitrella brassicaformis CCMP3155]